MIAAIELVSNKNYESKVHFIMCDEAAFPKTMAVSKVWSSEIFVTLPNIVNVRYLCG